MLVSNDFSEGVQRAINTLDGLEQLLRLIPWLLKVVLRIVDSEATATRDLVCFILSSHIIWKYWRYLPVPWLTALTIIGVWHDASLTSEDGKPTETISQTNYNAVTERTNRLHSMAAALNHTPSDISTLVWQSGDNPRPHVETEGENVSKYYSEKPFNLDEIKNITGWQPAGFKDSSSAATIAQAVPGAFPKDKTPVPSMDKETKDYSAGQSFIEEGETSEASGKRKGKVNAGDKGKPVDSSAVPTGVGRTLRSSVGKTQ
jgi:hypothetical protein